MNNLITQHISRQLDWMNDFWEAGALQFNSAFKSFLPYSFSVDSDKKTAQFKMALAGYAASDLEVDYSAEGLLTIKSGKQEDSKENMKYIHRGIALRAFSFATLFNPSYTLKDATLKNGMLTINFDKVSHAPTRVEVKSS